MGARGVEPGRRRRRDLNPGPPAVPAPSSRAGALSAELRHRCPGIAAGKSLLWLQPTKGNGMPREADGARAGEGGGPRHPRGGGIVARASAPSPLRPGGKGAGLDPARRSRTTGVAVRRLTVRRPLPCWRRRRDSNPRTLFRGPTVFETAAFSRTLPRRQCAGSFGFGGRSVRQALPALRRAGPARACPGSLLDGCPVEGSNPALRSGGGIGGSRTLVPGLKGRCSTAEPRPR